MTSGIFGLRAVFFLFFGYMIAFLAEKILSPAEKQRFAAAPDPRRALLAFWVLKEAQAKLTGEGLRIYPNHTDFSPEDPGLRELAGCLVAVLEEPEASYCD